MIINFVIFQPIEIHHVSDEKNLNQFEYDAHFNEMIDAKKKDHSYRVFRKVNRKAKSFPMADDYSFSDVPNKVTVWCSNDYLGMSRNPNVVNAAK